jgi:hypothetical protein
MAFRLRHWLVVVGLSLAVVAAWRLPLDSVPPGTLRQLSDAETRYSDLSRELHDARTVLDQTRRERRLPPQAAEAADDGVAILIPDLGSLPPETLSALRERIEREVAASGRREPDVLVGYGYDGSAGGETGLPVSEAHRIETYVGQVDGRPFCLQVVVTRPGRFQFVAAEDLAGRGWSRWTQSLLGPCVFYAAYGPASNGIQAWLEAGGSGFAFGHPVGDAPDYPRMQRRWLFGTGMRQLAGPTVVGRCLTGDTEACATMFVEPRRPDVSGIRQRERPEYPATFTGTGRDGPLPADDWFLLADVEREFGQDAFQSFWTSQDDVRTAFEASFGVDLGEWLLRWLGRDLAIERRSPAPSLPTTFAGLLVVALMTGFASAWHGRRTVS